MAGTIHGASAITTSARTIVPTNTQLSTMLASRQAASSPWRAM